MRVCLCRCLCILAQTWAPFSGLPSVRFAPVYDDRLPQIVVFSAKAYNENRTAFQMRPMFSRDGGYTLHYVRFLVDGVVRDFASERSAKEVRMEATTSDVHGLCREWSGYAFDVVANGSVVVAMDCMAPGVLWWCDDDTFVMKSHQLPSTFEYSVACVLCLCLCGHVCVCV